VISSNTVSNTLGRKLTNSKQSLSLTLPKVTINDNYYSPTQDLWSGIFNTETKLTTTSEIINNLNLNPDLHFLNSMMEDEDDSGGHFVPNFDVSAFIIEDALINEHEMDFTSLDKPDTWVSERAAATNALLADDWLNTTLADDEFEALISSVLGQDTNSTPTAPTLAPTPASQVQTPAPVQATSLKRVADLMTSPPAPKRPAVSAVASPGLPENAMPDRVKYLKRRQNNNVSAQRSRLKRKEAEKTNQERVFQLEKENTELKAKLDRLETEATNLREMIIKFAKKDNTV